MPPPPDISRRQFLKLAGLSLAAATLPEGLQRLIALGIGKGLTTPGVTDELVHKTHQLSEQVANSENPYYRPITEIIAEATGNFTAKTGNKVTYTRSPSYRDKYYYAGAIQEIANASLLPTLPSDAIHQLTRKFPSEAFFAYVSSDTPFGQFANLITSGSGFEARFKANHPQHYGEDGRIKDYDNYFPSVDKSIKTEIQDAKEYVENFRKDNANPVSAAEILEYFLKRNNGNLAQSVFDTTLFLKFMARNNPKTGGGTSEFNETWIKENIKDEYQGPSYVTSPKGESLINLVGKPYHSWNLVSLLQFFPVELIQAGGIYRQAITFKDQGLGKTRSDLQTLSNLREIEKLMVTYSPNE